jgi:hypothetical protein
VKTADDSRLAQLTAICLSLPEGMRFTANRRTVIRISFIRRSKLGVLDEIPHLQVGRALDICGDGYACRADSPGYFE